MFKNENGIMEPFGMFVVFMMMLMGVMAYQDKPEDAPKDKEVSVMQNK